MKFKRRRTHTILFKSGSKVHFRASEVTVSVGTMREDLRAINWKNAKGYPLQLDISQVAGVFVGKV